jgi:hypothetical protein
MGRSHLRFYNLWCTVDLLNKCNSLVVGTRYDVGRNIRYSKASLTHMVGREV